MSYHFKIKHFRKKKLLGVYKFKNTATVEGLLRLLRRSVDDVFGTSWFFGLIESGVVLPSDTGASWGFTEFTDYKVGIFTTERSPIDSRSGSVTTVSGSGISTLAVEAGGIDLNPTFDVILITAPGTIVGGFVISSINKGSNGGSLWGGGNIVGSPISVSTGDSLIISYSIRAVADDSFGNP